MIKSGENTSRCCPPYFCDAAGRQDHTRCLLSLDACDASGLAQRRTGQASTPARVQAQRMHACGRNPRPCLAAAPPLASREARGEADSRPETASIHLRDTGEHGRDAHLVPLGLGCPRLPVKRHTDSRLSRSCPRAGRCLSCSRRSAGCSAWLPFFHNTSPDFACASVSRAKTARKTQRAHAPDTSPPRAPRSGRRGRVCAVPGVRRGAED